MHMYRTVDGNVGDSHIALRDREGRFFVARCLNQLPPVGMVLGGDKPHLGFAILFCPATESVFRVIFERINLLDVVGLAVDEY